MGGIFLKDTGSSKGKTLQEMVLRDSINLFPMEHPAPNPSWSRFVWQGCWTDGSL